MTDSSHDHLFRAAPARPRESLGGRHRHSEKFYSEVCGLTVEFTEPDLVATFLGTGHTPHDLGMIQKTNGVDRYGRNGLLQLPGSIGHDAGLNHLAWELENEAQLVSAYRRLKDAGVATDMTVDHQVAHSVYMFDPDGNYNEFYCDTVKDWRTVLHGPMDLITSHWDPLSTDGFTEGRYETDPVLRTHATAPLRPRRISHAVLETPNMEAMLALLYRAWRVFASCPTKATRFTWQPSHGRLIRTTWCCSSRAPRRITTPPSSCPTCLGPGSGKDGIEGREESRSKPRSSCRGSALCSCAIPMGWPVNGWSGRTARHATCRRTRRRAPGAGGLNSSTYRTLPLSTKEQRHEPQSHHLGRRHRRPGHCCRAGPARLGRDRPRAPERDCAR